MAYNWKTNDDGSYTKIDSTGKQTVVKQGDPMYNTAKSEVNTWKKNQATKIVSNNNTPSLAATAATVTGGSAPSGTAANSVSSTSYTGQPTAPYQGNLILSNSGDAITRQVGDKYQTVFKDDPKFAYLMEEYNQTHNPYGDQGSDAWAQQRLAEGYDRYAGLMGQGRNAYEAAMRRQLGLAEDKNAQAVAATNRAYDQAANNAYVTYMQALRQMPQQMASLGLAGTGASESAALGAASNYQNNLNANEQKRVDAVNDLYLALQQNYADAASEQAAYENSLYQALANAYLDQYNTDRNYNYQLSRDSVADQRYADELAYDRQWREKEWQNALDQQNYERLKDRLSVAFDYGIPTKEAANFAQPGMTTQQLAAYFKRYYGF